MEYSSPPKLRAGRRLRMLKRGIVAYNLRNSTLECTVRDWSELGCLIQSDAHRMIPDTFELLIELDGLWYPCAVAWRRPPQVGVRFTGPPEAARLKRTQVIAQSAAARPSIRIKRG